MLAKYPPRLTCVVRRGYGGERQPLCQETRRGYGNHRCGEGLRHLGSGDQPLGVLPEKKDSMSLRSRKQRPSAPFISTCWEWRREHGWIHGAHRVNLRMFLMVLSEAWRITSKAVYSTPSYKLCAKSCNLFKLGLKECLLDRCYTWINSLVYYRLLVLAFKIKSFLLFIFMLHVLFCLI